MEPVREHLPRRQTQLAKAAGTSQATISAYERREKSPALGVVERLIGEAGYTLRLDHAVDFNQFSDETGTYWYPDRLWRVEARLCFSKVRFPDGVARRATGEWQLRYFDLADRDDRRRVYQYLLRAGLPVWIWRWVDGALLVELWEDLEIPDTVRKLWQPLIDHARNGPLEDPMGVGFDEAMKHRREERKAAIEARRAELRALAAEQRAVLNLPPLSDLDDPSTGDSG